MRDFQKPGRSPVYALNGMCAASHPLASQVAVRILQDGGNAADAAIAGAVILGLAEPQMAGLGGDCFALVKPPGDERVLALNGSGRAPAGLDAAALRGAGQTAIGTESVESVTVPGAVDAFCRLAEDWGMLELEQTLAPAIHYAEEGIPVAPRVSVDWAGDCLRLNAAGRRFYLPQGQAPQVGTIFRAPQQAEVLRRIARQGRAGFYDGEVAADMVDSLRALGGRHSLEDFWTTEADWGAPVTGAFAGHDLIEHPPNGQGATAILMLNILSHFDLGSLDPFSAARAHLEAEAAKLAYDARNRFIADPVHTTRLDHMLAPETASRLASMIDPARVLSHPASLTEAVHRDTVYITVVDRDRMAVSLIYSIYWGFGSGIASERFGVLMQNRGAGFTLAEGHPNEAGPAKRPMHTIIPGMIAREGRIVMPFGVMGGAYQPTGHVRFMTNVVTYGMDVQEAIDAPRSFAGDGTLALERGYAESVAHDLTRLGHVVVTPQEPLGGAQAILIGSDGVLVAGSDPRKDGLALGY